MSLTGVFVAHSVNTSSVLWFVYDAIAQGTNRQPAPQVLPCVESVVSSMAKRRMIVQTTGRSKACVVSTSVTLLSSLNVRRKRITGKIARNGNYPEQLPTPVAGQSTNIRHGETLPEWTPPAQLQ
ncbi:hypothetical protein HPB48_018623 [Haemaphysalis longicornis]|uniref:Uncharacterized protein n=1 Tax=Haemaphysalis longicornis TaxID=44386 RepID=A0A9J6GH95_HAELO|nr:hypothetical protein HPB48_018623 [Haemaphysalis longicornis]